MRVRAPGYWKNYYATHREQLRTKNPARYQKAKEATKARAKAWALAHPERRREIVARCKAKPEVRERAAIRAREYRKENAAYLNEKWHARRAKIRQAPGAHTESEWRDLKNRTGNKCLSCKKSGDEVVLTKDHIVPISKGGSNSIENIQPLCGPCNSRKLSKTILYTA